MKKIVVTIAALSTLSGCASWDIGARSYYDSEKDGTQRPGSRVFVWNSDLSAGIGNSDGQCAQGALTMTSESLAAALQANNATGTQATGGIDYARTAEALNVSSVSTAYANIAYFYLCQLALNAERHAASESGEGPLLDGDDISKMFIGVGQNAVALRDAEGTRISAVPPKLASALQALFIKNPNPTQEEIDATVADAMEKPEGAEEPAAPVEASGQ